MLSFAMTSQSLGDIRVYTHWSISASDDVPDWLSGASVQESVMNRSKYKKLVVWPNHLRNPRTFFQDLRDELAFERNILPARKSGARSHSNNVANLHKATWSGFHFVKNGLEANLEIIQKIPAPIENSPKVLGWLGESKSVVMTVPDEVLAVFLPRFRGFAVLKYDDLEIAPTAFRGVASLALVSRLGPQLDLGDPVAELASDRFGLEPYLLLVFVVLC